MTGALHAVAHHEADHAVVAQCWPPRQVGHDLARAQPFRPRRRCLGRTTAEKQIRYVGRTVAQRRFAPHSGWRSRNQSHLNSGYDFDSVAVLIDNEHGNGRVADLYSRYVNAKVRAACRGLLATDRDRRQCTARTRNADRSRMSQAMGDAATAAGAK